MIIKNLKVKNWRSIKDIELTMNELMIFLGQNNHGKSNILSAILFFFGNINFNDLDFNHGNSELFVEIEFTDLDENDKTTFKKYLNKDNGIKVRKTATKEDGFSYHGYLENPSEEWLRESAFSDFNSQDKISTIPLKNYVPGKGRITKDIFNQAIEKYIEDNKEDIEFNYELETSPFLGAKNIAQGIFGEVFFIPSVKDASSELSLGSRSSSIFNQIYTKVIHQISETSKPYKDAKEQISNMMKVLNKETEEGEVNEQRPEELSTLEQNISDELANWHTTIDIEITPPNIDDIFKVGASVWVDDGIKTDITRKGHGLQRAMIFALIKSWSKILKKERELTKDKDEEKSQKRKSSNSVFFIFEEPELYLHPQSQREFYDSLNELSKTGNQVLLSTHSSFFINLENYKSIVIVKKVNTEKGTQALQYLEELFDDADEKKNFNLVYWLNPDRSELFFSTKTILVEGPTDKIVIPFLAKQNDTFKYEYSVIDCGGKGCIKSYIKLLNRFRIPYCAVYDKDHQDHKDSNGTASADIESKGIEDEIDKKIGDSIILENDIEEEIGISKKNNKNKPYKALEYISDDEFKISDSFLEKIKKIYE